MTGFVTVIACIDGRVQEPLASWAKRRFDAAYADMVTRPGCDGVLAEGHGDRLRGDVEVSLRAHAPKGLVVSGHHDCAANPGAQRHHETQIRAGVEEVRRWVPDGLPVVGVYVNERWEVEPLA